MNRQARNAIRMLNPQTLVVPPSLDIVPLLHELPQIVLGRGKRINKLEHVLRASGHLPNTDPAILMCRENLVANRRKCFHRPFSLPELRKEPQVRLLPDYDILTLRCTQDELTAQGQR